MAEPSSVTLNAYRERVKRLIELVHRAGATPSPAAVCVRAAADMLRSGHALESISKAIEACTFFPDFERLSDREKKNLIEAARELSRRKPKRSRGSAIGSMSRRDLLELDRIERSAAELRAIGLPDLADDEELRARSKIRFASVKQFIDFLSVKDNIKPDGDEIQTKPAIEVALSSSFDAITLKSDRHTMEHPFFSLTKRRDTRIKSYCHNGTEVTIIPSALGHPTIWDKDILLYCVGKLTAAVDQGVQRRCVQIKSRELLRAIGRHDGGKDYKSLEEALVRLKGVQIRTNIATGGILIRRGFGLIEEWRVVSRTSSGRMERIEITVSEWLANAIRAREVLSFERRYLRLGGLERRLYELCRKHLGRQDVFRIGISTLHKKTGSIAPERRFAFELKNIARQQRLPGYLINYDEASYVAEFRHAGIIQNGTECGAAWKARFRLEK